MIHLPRLPLAVLLLLGVQEPGPLQATTLDLPDGRAAKVWAGVGPATVPAEPSVEVASLSRPGAWDDADTWRRWAELLTEARDAEAADPAHRAALCLLARNHGRARDAWAHFESLGPSPEWAAAVAPFLLPGVPSGTKVESGGVPAELADEVVLRPLLPPPSDDAPPGAIEWRTAKVQRLRVGDAVLDLTVTVENTGVQVDVAHVTGGDARVSIVLPEPEGFQIRVEYVDWMRVDTLREPLVLDVLAGEEEPHSLYGRIMERRFALPTGAARQLPRQMIEGGLALEIPADDPDREQLDAAAEALRGLLGVDVSIRTAGTPADGDWTGTTLRLPAGPERVDRLRYLASTVEAFVLRPPDDE